MHGHLDSAQKKAQGTGFSHYKPWGSIKSLNILRKTVLSMSHVENSPEVVWTEQEPSSFLENHFVFLDVINVGQREAAMTAADQFMFHSRTLSTATIETPQDMKMERGMTAYSKLRNPIKILVSMHSFSACFSCEITTEQWSHHRACNIRLINALDGHFEIHCLI